MIPPPFIQRLCTPLLALLLMALHGAMAEETKYVEGSVIVTFKPEASLGEAKIALSKKSLGFERHFGWLSARRNKTTGVVHHLSKSTAQLIADLKDDPTVETVEPDYLRWPKAVPNDTRFTDLWALRNTGQTVNGTDGVAGDDIKFVEAWNLARKTPSNIVVGVIDTGVDFGHPDLNANMWVNTAETDDNATDDDNNGYKDDVHGYDFASSVATPADILGQHGTHVAGTIAGVGNNQSGVIGVGYHAKIMGLKVSSGNDTASFSSSAILAALQYATLMKERGVNIVALNASYGGGGYSTAERAAMQAAGNAGIIFVAAAGNESSNNDLTSTYPASYRLPNMLVVAASDQKDTLAKFSNYGASTVDIAAPGTEILSAMPSESVAIKIGATTYTSALLTYSGKTPGLTNTIVECGIGNPGDFPAAVNGHIALIQRGTLNFSVKVANAKAAGAVAAIIYNNVNTDPVIFLGTLSDPGNWLPSLAISQADGFAIKAGLANNNTATLTPSAQYQYLDGTSMATPHVTGAVAFAALNFPNDTVAQRISRIKNGAEVKVAFKGKVASNGRLNLLRIVDANSNGVPDWLENATPSAPHITTARRLQGAVLGGSISQTLEATGGTAPYTFQLISGTLPNGITLSADGLLSGTPTATANVSLTVQVTDSLGAYSGSAFDLTISATPLTISTAADALPKGRMNAAYTGALEVSGGTAPYTWQVVGTGLPAGVVLNADGSLSGTPTAYGTFHFTAQATDAGALTASQVFDLVVDPLPLVITTSGALPPGVKAYEYTHPLTATGGAAPLAWSLISGTLPEGLTVDPAGAISGTPTEAGSFNFVLQVADSDTHTKTQGFTIAIEAVPMVITSTSPLIAGVRTVPIVTQTLTFSGGTAPFNWTVSAGTLPPGLKLTSAGVLSGTPTVAGTFNFTVALTDSLLLSINKVMQVTITPIYVKPVMNAPVFDDTTVGVPFTPYKVTAANYPRSYSIAGLPTGLTYSPTTGIISGRPTVGKSFTVSLRAYNPAGWGPIITVPFVVHALPDGMVGTFTGLVSRHPTLNKNLGSRFTLAITSNGYYTARMTTGITPVAKVGWLTTTAPQISIPFGTSTLSLTLDGTTNSLSGFYGDATVAAVRQAWTAAHKSTSRAGYYSVGLDLTDANDIGSTTIPQGSSYASFTVTTLGTLSVVGHLADGVVFTSATILGPQGEIPVHAPLYTGYAGSVTGWFGLSDNGPTPLTGNTAAGTLTWSKPTTVTRTYPAAFGPVSLAVDGKYLATSSVGQTVLGLPAPGPVNLSFAAGGVDASATHPNVTGLTYTPSYTVQMPPFASGNNPGKATLAINRNTGAFSGYFYLSETAPVLSRKVLYQGIIVRPASGDIEARGYFLLAQIPVKPQTILTSPILSGKVTLGNAPSAATP
ncbi:MAG: putative Ig protein [Verrucomicrobiaceae bacterium]|nr:putative Ig protein [Verrucomicrobiaceae bacterium]